MYPHAAHWLELSEEASEQSRATGVAGTGVGAVGVTGTGVGAVGVTVGATGVGAVGVVPQFCGVVNTPPGIIAFPGSSLAH